MTMVLRNYLAKLKSKRYAVAYRRRNRGKAIFECPGCGYVGPFEDISPETGLRIHAKCPLCGALERHRLQLVVLRNLLQDRDCSHMKALHFAPEPILRDFFSNRFGEYLTADLVMDGVDLHVDLICLPFEDETYDIIFASHVLEHIPDDRKAIREIHRVLRPGGIAVLPVPVVFDKTIEYSEPNPKESFHVRAPGLDYFERFDLVFSKVELFSSINQAEKYQLFVYEGRSNGQNGACRYRQSMPGERHTDFVPVCYKKSKGRD